MRSTRRELLAGALAVGAAVVAGGRKAEAALRAEAPRRGTKGMRLGTVTYNLAKDWDVPTLIAKCQAAHFEGVELRTTHAHGVEPSLGAAARKEVRQRFADSSVTLWGLGSICEFHSMDPKEVQANVETCKAFVRLAEDVGAKGVKVRPNGLNDDKGVPVEQTLEQIGHALTECGRFAAEHGVEIWVEVHGNKTQHPPHIRRIIDVASHASVGVCWNSNPTDLKDGSIREYFNLLKKDIRSCHITELSSDYPYRELFAGLKSIGYDRFTLAEVAESKEPERFMGYYRKLWLELQR